MSEAAPLLAPWTNFYVIVGSSAGALTGLQFVVIALVAQAEALGSGSEIRAFATPTVVHFCVALFISAIANAPWHETGAAALVLGACGGVGLVYALAVIGHARKTTGYTPDASDWIWYATLPLVAYAALLAGAIGLGRHPQAALFTIAGTSLLLLFIGIHNAWDTVTYVTMHRWGRHRRQAENREQRPGRNA